eukprot:COSAG01_NODE_1330_length_10699_cov_49.561604_11_plen_103_part_00
MQRCIEQFQGPYVTDPGTARPYLESVQPQAVQAPDEAGGVRTAWHASVQRDVWIARQLQLPFDPHGRGRTSTRASMGRVLRARQGRSCGLRVQWSAWRICSR